MTEDQLLLLWGKIDKKDAQKYHPLPFHLLDVGFCAGALWDCFVSPQWKKRIATTLGGIPPEEARRAVMLLAAWHDVGKAAPGFQLQPSAPQGLMTRLEACGLHSSLGRAPHAQVSAKFLLRWLCAAPGIWATDEEGAKILAHITGAHHGFFPHSLELKLGKDVLGESSWEEVRIELCRAVALLLAPGDALQTPAIEDKGAIAFLTGLISVADWLGSSFHFPPAGHEQKTPPTLRVYAGKSQKQAHKALENFGWLPPFRAAGTPLDFEAQFGFAPNPLQQMVLERTQRLEKPFLALVEAPMGVGKTEAAFVALDAALVQHRANGFYIALPTQATGNAMFDRVAQKFFAHARHGAQLNLQLVHSHAFLHRLESETTEWDAEESAHKVEEKPVIVAQEWFMGAKRPLLAPFGVGTIDQGLSGVLNIKHWFVRLFALAGKVVVFDEVHAYDTYMSELLTTLIGWLRELGCSVILLSATLPSNKRRALLEAWGAALPEVEKPYPRLTWAGETTHSLALPSSSARKNIALVWMSNDSPVLAEEVRRQLQDGGCAAIVCNTVGRAQTLFQELQNELGEEWAQWTLFHARMPFSWRQEREQEILRKFGKDKTHRPRDGARAIVIGTQVLEQSLDLDFDWMASELAPVDLLLQRAGRLHRHDETKRPDTLQKPRFVVLCDEENGFPRLELPPEIYDHATLLQTFRVLKRRKRLSLPRCIEPLIERVYVRPKPATDVDWEERLKLARVQAQKRAASEERAAQLVKAVEDDPDELAEDFVEGRSHFRDEDDPAVSTQVKARTRNGRPSIQVVCLVQIGDALFLPPTKDQSEHGAPVCLDSEPDVEGAQSLMKWAVPISHQGIFWALAKGEAEFLPPAWSRNSHLRYARALIFKDGQCQVNGCPVQLDATMGIVIGHSKDRLAPED